MIAVPTNQWNEPEWKAGYEAGVKAAQEQGPQVPVASVSSPQRRPFITGSRAYGTPRSDSDIDLVALLTPAEIRHLRTMDDRVVATSPSLPMSVQLQEPETYRHNSASLRFGRLNIICVSKTEDYDLWLAGTKRLRTERPVNRARAVQVFDELSIGVREDSRAAIPETIADDDFLTILDNM